MTVAESSLLHVCVCVCVCVCVRERDHFWVHVTTAAQYPTKLSQMALLLVCCVCSLHVLWHIMPSWGEFDSWAMKNIVAYGQYCMAQHRTSNWATHLEFMPCYNFMTSTPVGYVVYYVFKICHASSLLWRENIYCNMWQYQKCFSSSHSF